MVSLISIQLISSTLTCLMHTGNGLVTASVPEEVEVTWPAHKETKDVAGDPGSSESQKNVQLVIPERLRFFS